MCQSKQTEKLCRELLCLAHCWNFQNKGLYKVLPAHCYDLKNNGLYKVLQVLPIHEICVGSCLVLMCPHSKEYRPLCGVNAKLKVVCIGYVRWGKEDSSW